MSDENCLFCKIINGSIPCYKVYEDETALAFLDIHPCSVGHTVVIPKNHVGRAEEMSEDLWKNLAVALKKAAKRVADVVKADGLNIGLNDGPVAGQAVPHVHWHIIPRFDNDGGGSMHSIIRAQTPAVSDTARLFK
jgi:histidine triad (HIT) family protein